MGKSRVEPEDNNWPIHTSAKSMREDIGPFSMNGVDVFSAGSQVSRNHFGINFWVNVGTYTIHGAKFLLIPFWVSDSLVRFDKSYSTQTIEGSVFAASSKSPNIVSVSTGVRLTLVSSAISSAIFNQCLCRKISFFHPFSVNLRFLGPVLVGTSATFSKSQNLALD